MSLDEEHAQAVWDSTDFRERQEHEEAYPDKCRCRFCPRRADENVQERKETECNRPDVHACIVRLCVVEATQDVWHGKEPKEDCEHPCECKYIPDSYRL